MLYWFRQSRDADGETSPGPLCASNGVRRARELDKIKKAKAKERFECCFFSFEREGGGASEKVRATFFVEAQK